MNLEVAREVLLQHSKSTRNGQFPEAFTHSGKMTNPICGDHVELKFNIVDNHVVQVGYAAKACAICSASASLLCQEVQGKSYAATLALAQEFENELLLGPEKEWPRNLQGLHSFEHLKINPSRKACALLPWIALRSALKSAN